MSRLPAAVASACFALPAVLGQPATTTQPAVAAPGAAPNVAPAATAKETPEEFQQRTAWWREAKFGLFIHWGLYAVPADSTNLEGKAGCAEWYLNNKQAQVADYEKFAPRFNPVKFDASAWVKCARDAGMKYIVITSKHHDGFCLWDSKLTDWDVMDATPFKRDILKELAAECKKQGVRLCFYHSIMDWHHPDYLPRRPWEKDTRPAAGADYDRYVEHMKGQLRELITGYGPLGVLWFDGEWENTWTHDRGVDLYHYVRGLQPDILINNRVDTDRGGMAGMSTKPDRMGDFGTPEQEVPATGFADGRLWETCMTMNDTWGFAKNDTNWKSTETLIRHLCDIAHKGGNFLLNVGPTGEGEFPPESVERLAAMGRWLAANGDAIYGTTASPFKRLGFDGRCTRKGDKLYLHVFNWPDELRLVGLQTEIAAARVLDGGRKLGFVRAPDQESYIIEKPGRLDPLATVIELRLKGPPVVVPTSIRPDGAGVLTLKAFDADIHGTRARYESGGGKDNIGFWTDPQDYVSWAIESPSTLVPAPYAAEITYACPPENAGSKFTVAIAGDPQSPPAAAEITLNGTVESTGSWTTFRTFKLPGTFVLPGGENRVFARATLMPAGAVMNLRSLRLAPAR
ncbi:MAG: alpha-L-fucosidase [Planctomycetota bacterium]